MMFEAGHGVTLLSSITLHVMHLVCFAFADDTDLAIAGQHADVTGESIFSDFLAALDRWAGGADRDRRCVVPREIVLLFD